MKPNKDSLTERIAGLSPAKRALLELRLKSKGSFATTERTIPRRATTAAIPLSFAQQRMWFLDQLEPDSPLYVVYAAMQLTGFLNVEALQKALETIVTRHEVLRTTFVTVDGRPIQVVHSPGIELPIMDLMHFPNVKGEEGLKRLVREDALRPFSLSCDRMLRATLFRLHREQHIFLLTMHHIASDGWSMGILFREISVLYDAYCRRNASPLPELPIQYADFAVWQRHALQGEVLETQLSYWKKQLDGVSPLQLLTDRPRPLTQSFRGAKRSLAFSKKLTEDLKALSRREAVTLFMTLLAAFQTLLHRYTAQDDVAIGSPIAGRTRLEVEGLIGFFVNTLVLRTDLSGKPSFRELLGRVREVALEAYAHQDLPFEKLVEELQPERNLSCSPLFQVMFVFQNASSMPLKLEGLTLSPLELENGTAKFDLTVSIREEPHGLKTSLQYNTDLFDSATILRMQGHFQTLLEGIVANPQQRISDLPILTSPERQQLLVEWNNTQKDYPRDKCIHELFESQVEQTPQAVAVVFGDQQLTYQELNERANQLAHYLRRLGVRRDMLVGICTRRSLEMVIATLGVLKAGAAYVPLDPGYPRERLAFMLSDSRVQVVLTQNLLIERLPHENVQIVSLEACSPRVARESKHNPRSGASGETIAYVIYTSGSTGKPKGIAVPHRAVNRLVLHTDYVTLDSSDVVAQASSYSFDASTFEIWGALLNGARLVILSRDLVLSSLAFAQQIEKNGITVLFLTTALFNQLAARVPTAFKGLRYLLFGGESVAPKWVREVLRHAPPKRLLHVYGPTETTTFASWHLVENVAKDTQTIPIGRPIANTWIYLLDEHLQPVPVGVSGELYIGGDGLARGYLNRPKLTAEKFIPDPFCSQPEARLYKTGDIGRYLPDGAIEFLGRRDRQVKVRGFRIELGEIETALAQHPKVSQATVLVREEVPGEKQLVAYLVCHDKRALTSAALRAFLKEKLPGFMVPSVFVLLDSLPLTLNGKVDREALPAPGGSVVELESHFVPPRSPTEELLASIWAEVLKLDKVGIDDNFFDLGGHSLLAMALLSRLRETFEVELPVRTLYTYPTVAGVASRIETQWHSGRPLKERDTAAWSFLFPLKAGNGKRPVFFLPGGIGGDYEYLIYARMVHYIRGDYSFYGFRARSADGTQPAHGSVEEMAADYLKEIRSVQPEDPYFLVGNCIGGIVAYEIGCQLQEQGQRVALLALMDTYRPTRYRYLRYRVARLKERIRAERHRWQHSYYVVRSAYHWEELKKLGWANKFSYLFIKGAAVMADLPRKLSQTKDSNGNGRSHKPEHIEAVQESYIKTLRRYRPKPYNGRICIIVNEESYRKGSTLGWASLVSEGIEVYKARGDHEAYIRDHVQAVAKQLHECLEKAERERCGIETPASSQRHVTS
jgi:amino acid adenylation domain-containing protein